MTESYDLSDPLEEVEAMVRAAGDYIRASDDLRPRVLEAARLQCRERSARRWVGHLAVAVLLLALTTVAGRHSLEAERSRPVNIAAAAGFDEFLRPTTVSAHRSGDGDWRMFEAFTELRREQARLLLFAL